MSTDEAREPNGLLGPLSLLLVVADIGFCGTQIRAQPMDGNTGMGISIPLAIAAVAAGAFALLRRPRATVKSLIAAAGTLLGLVVLGLWASLTEACGRGYCL